MSQCLTNANVRMHIAIILVFEVYALSAFCPAGFDDQDDFDTYGLEERSSQWQCARGQRHDGEIIFDAKCLENIKGGFAGPVFDADMADTQAGKLCDWYWGSDEGENGYWDRMTGEFGVDYWDCYASGKSLLVAKYGEEAISEWPEDRWHQARMVIDKRCVSSELCAIEHSKQGWCSDFYRENVMPSCGPEDSYTMKYCTEVCPPPLHEDFLADLNNSDVGKEDLSADLDLDKHGGENVKERLEEQPRAVFPPPRASKCPVKRAAFFCRRQG